MKAEYILGVDGGNTKTHYFLYDGEGNFVDCIKAGTCSHEALPDSYVGTGRELDRRLTELFSRNKIHRIAFHKSCKRGFFVKPSYFGLRRVRKKRAVKKITLIL